MTSIGWVASQADSRTDHLPLMERLDFQSESTILVSRRIDPGFRFNWHWHQQFELTLIINARGRRFVADRVDSYGPGDLVLLAPGVPHTWESPLGGHDEAVVIHFSSDFFSAWPESKEIVRLLESARHGIRFTGPGLDEVEESINLLPAQDPITRVACFLEVLHHLATRPDIRLYTLVGTPDQHGYGEIDWRVDKALDHIALNSAQDLRQSEVANLVGLDPSSFARLFKQSVGRTFTDYVQSLRIGLACRALSDPGSPISDVAFSVGFRNLASFNRTFLKIKGMTPSQYRQSCR